MSEAPRFGTAGLSDSYRVRSFDPQAMAEYTASFGLTAFEYQCGRGVRLGLDKAAALKEAFDAKGITFSVHAPYYISMSSLEEDKRLNSVNYLLQSAALCRALGGRRVIFHSGSCGRQSREAALEKALDTLKRAQDALDEAGFAEIILCPETMGKIGQLGTLEEVLALCGVDSRITPCIDFGHLNARTLGGIQSKADYAAILDRLCTVLLLASAIAVALLHVWRKHLALRDWLARFAVLVFAVLLFERYPLAHLRCNIDYGVWGILLILCLSYAESRWSRALVVLLWGALFYSSLGMPDWGSIRGTAAAALLLLLYNGERSRKPHPKLNKAFYAAYPLHLVVIWAMVIAAKGPLTQLKLLKYYL